ncbi:LPS export ABC transporter permease LptG [Pseudogemmobacter blasticus]|uniref:LPS export ABC transporter permease LptG n=1 Tax=Fuscovulum blasticum DSM 2131 TaxID=1188250 RepID=A0A2T4JAZ9_FUSBL|nr:LPS export ABC transporter permease LptG [Fuscovulum blasticum]AWD20548.1 LPS export ABC transporter permease LptG [Fuscovulum blasticum]PTE15007.1 LPS export ABC transporter permease LptG [Fuscovulum blasticum DSM 2131]
MTLSLYIARRFLMVVAQVFLIFFGILMLIDMIEQLRKFSGQNIGLGEAAHLSLLNVPETLYRILPLILIIAAITLFLALARSSELVVVRAAGRSGLRFLATPVIVATALGMLTVAVLNPLVAATSKTYEDLRSRYLSGGAVLSVSDTGLWLRQGGDYGQTVIQAARSNLDGTELYNVSFLTFGPAGTPVARIEAREARLETGAWRLDGAKHWDLDAPNPELSAESWPDGTKLPSDLTPERIRDSFGTPSTVPIWQLPGYISGLERAGFSSRSYKLWFQMELAQPLLLTAMVLVAAGFTMRPTRFGGTGKMVLLAMLAGFALFFLRNFAQALGESGQIPLALAAWGPPAAAVMLALGLLLHLEDG